MFSTDEISDRLVNQAAAWLVVLALLIYAHDSKSATVEVAPAGRIQSVAQAIAMAQPGDTIRISHGTYVEHDVVIDRPMTLQGIDWPVLDASGKGPILTVTSENVTVTGIEFRAVPVSFVKEHAAILVSGTSDCEIRANRFTNNFFAVYLAKSSRCRVVQNTIQGSADNLTTAGNGIHLWYCRDVAISNNTVFGHRDGIYLEFTRNSVMTNNVSEGNLRYGLHFMFSDSCRYENNRFIRNGAGVAVMYTSRVDMVGNEFVDSWGGAAYGMLLKDIKDSKVSDNIFTGNSVGIYMEGSDRIQITQNRFTANGWALKIMANCVGSSIIDNDFIDNSFQVTTNSRQSFSTFRGNYWSPYRGLDLDRDGFGDQPFRPVSLYSLLVESDPPTLVLVRSLLIEVLDLAERVIPTLTPETLVDCSPRMRPVT